MRIWDHGVYETHKFDDSKVEVTFHGERLRGRYGLFPLHKRKGEPPGKDWMIHRMDPAEDPDREAMPEKVVPMLARLADLPSDPRALGVRGEVGRRARAGLLRARPTAAGGAQRQRHHEALSRAAPAQPRAELAQRDPRRRDRRVRRPGPSELRPPPAPDAHRVRGPGEAPVEGVPGRLRDLRPAVARRALGHGPALHGPARAAGASRAEGPELAGPRLRHRRRPRPAGGDPRAGPGGDRRQAPGQPLRAGAAVDLLAQDQERPAHGRRRLRLDAGGGPPSQVDRRAARRPSRRTVTCATRAASGPASPTASSIACSSS